MTFKESRFRKHLTIMKIQVSDTRMHTLLSSACRLFQSRVDILHLSSQVKSSALDLRFLFHFTVPILEFGSQSSISNFISFKKIEIGNSELQRELNRNVVTSPSPTGAGADDKGRAQTLEEVRGKVTLGSRVQWHMRSCVARTGAEPEPAT